MASIAQQFKQLQTIIDENLATSRLQRVTLTQAHARTSSTSSNESGNASRLSLGTLEQQGSMERDVSDDVSDSDVSDHVTNAARTPADETACVIS